MCRWAVLVVIAAHAAVATAGPALARTPSALLGGRLRVRLADGMSTDDGGARATLDWGSTRFVVWASSAPPRRDARDDLGDAGCAPVVKIAARVWGSAPAPRAGRQGVLVYAAVATALDGDAVELRFYVDPDAIDDARAWAALARAIAATGELTIEPARHRARPRPKPRPTPPDVPGCSVLDGELDAHPVAPADVDHVPGALRGPLVYWSVWGKRRALHQEVMVGAARSGMVHVVCNAHRRSDLTRQRAAVERAFQADAPP